MAPKTTTKKPLAKKAKTDPLTEEEVEKKKFRVAALAGLLTYNNPVVVDPSEEQLKKHHSEQKAKFKHPIKLTSVFEKETRLHLHDFFESEVRIDCDLQYFATSVSGPVGDFVPNNGKNVSQGHWYCQCEFKSSHICAVSDLPPVLPKLQWLTDKWQQNKIERIKEALAAAKLSKPPVLAWIDAVNNAQEQKRIEEELAARQARVQATLIPFAQNPKVELWKAKFEVETLRYPFLVLCGPSKMRKTEFAKALFESYFHHKDKIDWDGYKWKTHKCIIFDDINLPDHIWKYVRQNKVMFQSSSVVAVNTSSTNCYKRDVCVVQTPIIICTNDGLLEPFVSAPYREWIESNSVWLDIDEPMPLVPPGCDCTEYQMCNRCRDHPDRP